MKIFLIAAVFCIFSLTAEVKTGKYNVVFIISDDLSPRALACYGNKQ